MSGGAFDYDQYRINDIVDKIEEEIKSATMDKPEPTTRTYISTLKRTVTGPNSVSYGSCYYNFRFIEEALKYFETLGLEIKKIDDTRFQVVISDKECIDVAKVEEEIYLDEDGNEMYFPVYTPETLEEFKKGVKALKKAKIYADRIDWLLSGDDSEKSFHKRLTKELEGLENEQGN